LARNADIRLLTVDLSGLVNDADRPGITVEELKGPFEDAFEQRLQGELAGKVRH
jgi:hypothetical protein